ncbi:hypothetical protein XELAEV_18044769mg [Xenopus laevis]|uniref:Uncharacterized protein n=1 Tax=Xenopus laevis TaxID=8355 RepID=A0A974BZJ4_XENLA|nr:hypothetical protein XELAEV_18044769mg [Xenopus laevis]
MRDTVRGTARLVLHPEGLLLPGTKQQVSPSEAFKGPTMIVMEEWESHHLCGLKIFDSDPVQIQYIKILLY